MKTHIAKSLVYIKTKPGKTVSLQTFSDAATKFGFGVRNMEIFTGDWNAPGLEDMATNRH